VGDVLDRDATAVAEAVRSGEVSASEVLDASMARLAERNPVVNAVVAVRAAARDDVGRGLPDGPLTGVPFVVKDLGVDVAGMPTTNGSRLFVGGTAERDSEIVARYRRAGVVIIGTTNSPELGRNASTEPLLHGPTRNPHRLSHSPGGSSGGTAAAVAVGIVPAGHGNDGGGSIRIPASACGLIGLKPSRGRTPAAPRYNAMAYPMGVNHALTRTVRDTALLLDVAQGPVSGDPYVIAPPLRPFVDEVGAPPGRCRVAMSCSTPAGDPIDAACESGVRRIAALLEELGHDVTEAEPPYPTEALSTAMRVFMSLPMAVDIDARLAVLHRDLQDDDLEPFTRMLYDSVRSLRPADVIVAHQQLEEAARSLGPFFADHDLLLTATMARPVPPLGLLDTSDIPAMLANAGPFSTLTSPWNVTGQPAISLPAGVDDDGLPLGAQLVAGFGREDLLIRVASQLEETAAWPSAPVWPTVGVGTS
jgi:amidase